MSNIRTLIFTSLLLLLTAMTLAAQTTLRLCELNTENFFDTQHQPGHEDTEYTQKGAKRWGLKRYWTKQQNMAKLLISMGDNRPPDIIALTEIENDSVINDLCRRSLLRRVGYKSIMTHSNDSRGINVALLYQPETFKPVSCDTIRMKPELQTRDILHVAGRLVNDDTIHVYVLHLSSRVGGNKAKRNREYECRQLMDHINGIRSNATNAKIIITGDFNDTPTSPLLTQTLRAELLTADLHTPHDTCFYNLSANHSTQHGISGTYKYNNKWETIDQCIVSGNLLLTSSKTRTSHDDFKIWAPDFILETDEEDLKLKPFRTYNNYKYNGGFSDHLPIIVDFNLTF